MARTVAGLLLSACDAHAALLQPMLLLLPAGRCRIAKLLLFSNLVPEEVLSAPRSDGQAVHMRRLWRHPGTGAEQARQEARSTRRLPVRPATQARG